MDRANLDEFIANAALLAAHLTRQCEKAVSAQQDTMRELHSLSAAAKAGMSASDTELERCVGRAVRDGLAGEIAAVSRSLGNATKQLQQMDERLRVAQAAVDRGRRIPGAVSIPMIGIAAAAIVLGTFFFARHHVHRAERARVQAEVLEALSQVAITSCDGRPCLKLEDGLARWAKNDDYVLVDTGAVPDTAGE